MNTEHHFQAGFTEVDFTPAPGLPLQGQMHERIATGARDPLLACSIALRQGATTAVIVAADICMIDVPFVNRVQQRWAAETGLPAHSLLIHATHTHDGPAPFAGILATPDAAFVASLEAAIFQSGKEALSKLEPVEVFAGTGHMEQMGWNRRAMFEDGTTRMYGSSADAGFIGMEGPRDPALPVLFTKNVQGEITGVLLNFATHPNSIESAEVYSADVPGAVRRHLRNALGAGIGVVYLTGAAGNTAPSILDPVDPSHPWRYEGGLERSGLYLAGEAAKVVASTIYPMPEPQLELQQKVLQIPLRPWPQPGEPTYPKMNWYYERAEHDWPGYLKNGNPVETRVNVLRIGEVALCTNPAELFVEFGLAMREASPARVTFISELTDGYVGYVPTALAFSRGGYETWCAPSSKLDESAGDQIVTATREMLQAIF